MRTGRAVRILWAAAYACFTFAGVVAFFSPSQLIASTLIKVFVYGWASFLTAGGGLCFIGKTRDSWAGEIVGLPMLSTANLIFGFLLLSQRPTSASIAIGGMFCGVGIALISRWVEMRRLAKVNEGVNREL